MAKRRCIGVDVYENELFIDLSDKAKVLYTYFILRCDDEGVIINPGTAMRLCNAGEQEMCELTETGFVIELEGVYVIRHWHAQNKIPPTKRTDSIYRTALSVLTLNEQMIYEFKES